MTKIGVVVGTLRKESFSRKWATNIVGLLPEGFEVEFLEIGNLPLYNEEYDANSPAEYTAFRDSVARQDAIIFATGEYNRSIPGALKNALDVASRPWGQSVWAGKPAMVVSHSISGISGSLSQYHLRQILSYLDMPILNQPEVMLANSQNLIGEDGKVNNQGTLDFLQSVVDVFVPFIAKHQA